VNDSIRKYKWKMWWNGVFGSRDTKNIEPIHFMRRYYGEKFAILYLFFNHYVAYLTIPAIAGIVMFMF